MTVNVVRGSDTRASPDASPQPPHPPLHPSRLRSLVLDTESEVGYTRPVITRVTARPGVPSVFFVLALLLTLAAAGFLALALMDQRALRRWFAARQGRDPSEHEPSGAGYVAGRIAWLALAGMFAFGAFQTWGSAEYFSVSESEAREIVEDAVADLEAEPRLPTLVDGFESYVSDAVRDAAEDTGGVPSVSLNGEGVGKAAARSVGPGDDAGAAGAGGDGGGTGGVERYDVSLDDGAYRYCLVVTSTESDAGGMTVPGAVQGQTPTRVPAYDLAVKVEKGGC